MAEMHLVDEIAHRHNALGNRVTDFYFAQRDATAVNRFKVIETAQPTHVVGGEVEALRYDYVAHVFRNGWVEVGRFGEEHVDNATHAAMAAHRIVTAEGSSS